jgi:hypothetical protein
MQAQSLERLRKERDEERQQAQEDKESWQLRVRKLEEEAVQSKLAAAAEEQRQHALKAEVSLVSEDDRCSFRWNVFSVLLGSYLPRGGGIACGARAEGRREGARACFTPRTARSRVE